MDQCDRKIFSETQSLMPRNQVAVTAGHICLDIIPTVTDERMFFQPGKLVEVGPAVLCTGGSVSNTGLALHILGISTRLMGKIGDDIFGRAILEMINGYDPDLKKGMIEIAGEVSSYSIILSSPGADRMFFHCPGCNDTFGADDVDYESLEGAALFHFGYPPLMRRMIERDGIELARLFSRAKGKGLVTSLDMSMPDPASFSGSVNWPSILSKTLSHVDIFLPSVEEILYVLYPEIFSSMSEPLREIAPELLTKIGNDLLSMGPKIVGLKL